MIINKALMTVLLLTSTLASADITLTSNFWGEQTVTNLALNQSAVVFEKSVGGIAFSFAATLVQENEQAATLNLALISDMGTGYNFTQEIDGVVCAWNQPTDISIGLDLPDIQLTASQHPPLKHREVIKLLKK